MNTEKKNNNFEASSNNNDSNFRQFILRSFLTGATISLFYFGKSMHHEYTALREYRTNTHLAKLEKIFNESGPEAASNFDSENYNLYQDTLNNYFSELKKSDLDRDVGLYASTATILLPLLFLYSSKSRKKI